MRRRKDQHLQDEQQLRYKHLESRFEEAELWAMLVLFDPKIFSDDNASREHTRLLAQTWLGPDIDFDYVLNVCWHLAHRLLQKGFGKTSYKSENPPEPTVE